jgi:hypothetical protein
LVASHPLAASAASATSDAVVESAGSAKFGFVAKTSTTAPMSDLVRVSRSAEAVG